MFTSVSSKSGAAVSLSILDSAFLDSIYGIECKDKDLFNKSLNYSQQQLEYWHYIQFYTNSIVFYCLTSSNKKDSIIKGVEWSLKFLNRQI